MRQKLEDENPEIVRMFPLPQPRHLAIYFNQRESPVLLPDVVRFQLILRL